MIENKKVYIIKSPWGPTYRVYNPELAEELLLRSCAKFNQRFEMEVVDHSSSEKVSNRCE